MTWAFLATLEPLWHDIRMIGYFCSSHNLLTLGTFPSLPVPRIGSHLLASLASGLPSKTPPYSGSPGAFFRRVRLVGVVRNFAFGPTSSFWPMGRTAPARSNMRCWAHCKWLSCPSVRPPVFRKRAKLLMSRSSPGSAEARQPAHLFTCSRERYGKSTSDHFVALFRARFSSPPLSYVARGVSTGFRRSLPFRILSGGPVWSSIVRMLKF